MGWMTGFEPATSGTTIRRSNQLSYTHHISAYSGQACPDPGPYLHTVHRLVRQKGFEPLTYCLEGSCSILLSYWRARADR